MDPSGHSSVCPAFVDRVTGEINARTANRDDVKKLSGHLREKMSSGIELTPAEKRAAQQLGLLSVRENRQRSIWKNFTGETASGEVHHGFPEQFKNWFAERDINVNNVAFYYDLPEGIHRRSDENGIHTNNNPLGTNWNNAWQQFIDTNPNATKMDVFKQLLYMENKTGISGYCARK